MLFLVLLNVLFEFMTIIDEIFFDSSLTIIFKSKITSPGESLGNLGSRMELSMIQNQISMNLDDDYMTIQILKLKLGFY